MVRSAVISQTILLRQVGVVLGPLSIFGVKQLNFTLPGGRQVNQYNALGFCLTFLWLLVFILVFALYHDKGKSHKNELSWSLIYFSVGKPAMDTRFMQYRLPYLSGILWPYDRDNIY